MPVCGAVLLPNSPLLLPGLKDQVKQAVAKTRQAITDLAVELLARQPDMLFLISSVTPTTILSVQQWSLWQAPLSRLDFSAFGDLLTNLTSRGAVGFTHRLKEKLETKFNLPLVTGLSLPYTAGVPLVNLVSLGIDLPVVYLQVPSNIEVGQFKVLGEELGDFLQTSPERIILVAAGELGLTTGYRAAEGKLFNQQFVGLAQAADWGSLFNLPLSLRQDSGQTVWSPAMLVYSILKNSPLILVGKVYEAPLGVGWLTAEFNFS